MPRLIVAIVLLGILSSCSERNEFSAPPESFDVSTVYINGDSTPRIAATVDTTFFGPIQPLLGRLPRSEDRARASRVVVISYAFWTERLGRRPEVIGEQLTADGVSRTIIGVMPQGIDLPAGVAFWIPRGG